MCVSSPRTLTSLLPEPMRPRLGANKFVLIRQFRREMGTTPRSYRNLLRVERARELLARGVTATEIASVLGFADQAHFSRRFKRVVGLTRAPTRAACAERRLGHHGSESRSSARERKRRRFAKRLTQRVQRAA